MCDRCPRVVCTSHICLPSGSDTQDACFLCMACHIRSFPKASPYFVSSQTLSCSVSNFEIYFRVSTEDPPLSFLGRLNFGFHLFLNL